MHMTFDPNRFYSRRSIIARCVPNLHHEKRYGTIYQGLTYETMISIERLVNLFESS